MKKVQERRLKEERTKGQSKEVRAWRNPHINLATAMLRNFILLLKHMNPQLGDYQREYDTMKKEKIKEIYGKMLEKDHKIRRRVAKEIIWITMKEVFRGIIRKKVMNCSYERRKLIEWMGNVEILINKIIIKDTWTENIESLINKIIIKDAKEEEMEEKERKFHTEAAAVKGIKNPVKTVVATAGKPLNNTINRTGRRINTIMNVKFIRRKKCKTRFKEVREKVWFPKMKVRKYNRLITINMEEHITQMRYELGLFAANQITISDKSGGYANRLKEILEIRKYIREENAENVTNRIISSEHPPIPMADDDNNRNKSS
jgi:hypothetical protein